MARQVVGVDAELATGVNIPIDPLLPSTGDASHQPSVDVADLFSDHRLRLVGLAFAITFDAGVAEDVVQDAFVGLQRHSVGVRDPMAYLQRSVVNLSISVVRRRRLSRQRPALPPAQPASSPEIDEMWARVQRLPPRQRAVVVLRYWQDMSLAEIATVLERPLGSIKSTLHRALKSLKEDLS